MFEKNCNLDQIFDRVNILKKCFLFLFFWGVAFTVPSRCSFLKFQLHVIKKREMTFAELCFYLH